MVESNLRGMETLRKTLSVLDGRPGAAYDELTGEWDYDDFTLFVDFVPEDPAAQSARFRARVPLEKARFPRDVFNTKSREIGARGFLARSFAAESERIRPIQRGRSAPRIHIDRPGRELLETTSVVVAEGLIEARFTVDLPLRRDRISGPEAAAIFNDIIPNIVRSSLIFKNLDGDGLADWLEANDDADAARALLVGLGLVAFIADGAFLPGRGREDTSPTAFRSPDELAVTLELPNAGSVRGMGIPKGITVIAGGFGSGKSTLLRALELGVYNHVPGDGKELVVTAGDTVGVRTEEGRRIESVDLSPFFASGDLDMRAYSVRQAAPAVSMAANIMEALEIGTTLLVIDGDEAPAEIITRDARIQALIPPEREPATPLVDLLPALRDSRGVSTVISVNAGDYLDIADTVIVMDHHLPVSGTSNTRRIVKDRPSGRTPRTPVSIAPAPRLPLGHTLEPEKSRVQDRQRPQSRGFIQYGDEFIDCSRLPQLVSAAQERSLARALALVHRLVDGAGSLGEAVRRVMERVEAVGLDTLSGRQTGDLASFRAHELAAAVNRLKKLKIK